MSRKRISTTATPSGSPLPKKRATRSSRRAATRDASAPKPIAKEEPEEELSVVAQGDVDRGEPERFWLMKAEPETRIEKGKDVKFSIDDLAACKEPQGWDGVRNYGARNNLKSMKVGEQAFFYHSNCKTPGIVGIMEIVRAASVDATAFDPTEPYYDPKSDPASPKWFLVHVRFARKFTRTVGLHELKTYAHAGGPLATMPLLKQGRLSVSAVPKDCWDFVMSLVDLEKED